MCGVALIATAERTDLGAIFRMTAVQAHRGPDGSGHAVFDGADADPGGVRVVDSAGEIAAGTVGRIALGHRRLSIIDVSDAGRQPLRDDSGRYWISYNGEVYNYVELREELRAEGERFVSESDTEVVLAAYRRWGTGCFARFNGMWAIVIWDSVRRVIVLSRDRFGVKPLHYATRAGTLVAASEIKGVLAADLRPARMNASQLAAFLHASLVNHSDQTAFADIMSFPPGHYAEVTLGAPDRIEPRRFWSLEPGSVPSDFNEAVSAFRELLDSAVRLRLRSDVPVGSCLSGGIDSSSIVATMALLERGLDLRTFTAHFPGQSVDERSWAEAVVRATGARAVYVEPTEEAFAEELDAMVWHQEEPIAGASIFAQWKVMRAARENGIPVLLDGQGADEALCGYKKFYPMRITNLLANRQPLTAASELIALLRHGDRGFLRWREALRYLPASLRPRESRVGQYLAPLVAADDSAALLRNTSASLHAQQVLDLTVRSIPALLRYEDRSSMAWSIESRVPFLDYRLVAFSLGLPDAFKLRGGQTKAILRTAMRGRVPDAVLDRRDKLGFVAPQQSWMLNRTADRMWLRIDQSDLARSLADTVRLRREWNAASRQSRLNLEPLVFRLGMVAAWGTRFGVG